MATEEQKQEQAGRQALVEKRRSVDAARAAATKGPYSPAAWEPWRTAAAEYEAAVTEHAVRHGVNRYELEQDVMVRARPAQSVPQEA